MKNSFLLMIMFVGLTVWEAQAGDNAGGQPGTFLRRGVVSRALAMGNAYTSVANDASSIYWNAAGLSQIERIEFQGMYSVLTFDRQQLFVGLGGKINETIAVGIGWYKFGVNNIDGRDALGNPTQKFDDAEKSFMASVALRIGNAALGLTGKYLHHSLADKSATGFGVDVGVIITLFDILNVGLVLQDIGAQLSWNTSSNLKETVPLTTRAGVAFRPDFIPIVISTELIKTGSGDIGFKAGGEYRIVEFFGIRAGYDGDNLTFGGFVRLPMEFLDTRVDYAATQDVLQEGYVHHVTIVLGF